MSNTEVAEKQSHMGCEASAEQRNVFARVTTPTIAYLYSNFNRSSAEKRISAAAFLSRHPSAANYLTVELAALKELSQELAKLFGLTLPFSLKR